jgi:hypothetical protein
MTSTENNFRAEELCSRKLWELVNTAPDANLSESALQAAIRELSERRHYLAQLQELGKLAPRP